MKRLIPLALFASALLACSRGDAQPAGVKTPPQKPAPASASSMQHHEVLAASLPKPFATESAGNPPFVIARPAGAKFTLPPGFSIALWAEGFSDPRNMAIAPNGDVFVADSSGGKIVVLRDTNRDGSAELRWTFAEHLNRPFGLAFRGSELFVGNTDAIVKFAYRPGQTAADGKPKQVLKLPRGGHATRNLIFDASGSKLYVAVGSRSNVDDESDDPIRAAITELNPDGSGVTTFASGLRNPIGLALNPADHALWTVVNERDGLGDDLVPDYATEVRRGAFYGWPFSYIGSNPDPRRNGERPDLVAKATVPSVLFQAHSAPITLAFYQGTMFPERYRGGAFVALHGSWNRSSRTGYKVVHIPFRNGRPAGGYDDFVLGWAPDPEKRTVWGRPAGVAVLPDGSLLVTDDGAGVIWRVTYRP